MNILNFDHILNIVMNSLLAQLFVNRCMEFSNSLQASRKQCVDMHIQCQYTPISLFFGGEIFAPLDLEFWPYVLYRSKQFVSTTPP